MKKITICIFEISLTLRSLLNKLARLRIVTILKQAPESEGTRTYTQYGPIKNVDIKNH